MRAAVVKEFNKNLRACLKKEGITQKMLAEISKDMIMNRNLKERIVENDFAL